MRRILLAVMSTTAAVVVLFGYRTSTAHPVAAPTVAAGTADTSGATSTTPAAPLPSSTSSPSSTASTGTGTTGTPTTGPTSTPTATTKTVTGQTAQTRWGPVQVQLTVSGGKVTGVDLLQVPSGNSRDAEINDQAVPVLKQETLQAQSAQIDAVSGATVTSDGYVSSLQSALDEAGL